MRRNYKLILIAVMTAVGVALQVFEAQLPIPVSLPGGKIGLANIVGLVLIPTLGGGIALAVSVLRALLGSLMFGGFTGGLYSVGGAVLSACAMILAYKLWYPRVTLIGIGVIGAAAHNTAQVTVAAVLLGNAGVLSYLPILIIIAVASGSFTGFTAELIGRRRFW